MKTLLKLPEKNNFFLKKKGEKTHSGTRRRFTLSHAYLFHVNTMPGYFEDQDKTRANKKNQILYHDKKQRINDHILSRI